MGAHRRGFGAPSTPHPRVGYGPIAVTAVIADRPRALPAGGRAGGLGTEPTTVASGRPQVLGRALAPPGVVLHLEVDLLALAQRVHAGPLDRRDVHEHVRRAVVRPDEAVALGGVEPLHRAGRHPTLPGWRRPAAAEGEATARAGIGAGRGGCKQPERRPLECRRRRTPRAWATGGEAPARPCVYDAGAVP